MTTYPNSPKVLKDGIADRHPDSASVYRIIALQYNPDSLTRTLQAQTACRDAANRSKLMRFKGPATESIKLDAKIDATDLLEHLDQNANAVACIAPFNSKPAAPLSQRSKKTSTTEGEV